MPQYDDERGEVFYTPEEQARIDQAAVDRGELITEEAIDRFEAAMTKRVKEVFDAAWSAFNFDICCTTEQRTQYMQVVENYLHDLLGDLPLRSRKKVPPTIVLLNKEDL